MNRNMNMNMNMNRNFYMQRNNVQYGSNQNNFGRNRSNPHVYKCKIKWRIKTELDNINFIIKSRMCTSKVVRLSII